MAADKEARTYSTTDSTFAVIWVMCVPCVLVGAIFVLLVLCSLRPRVQDAAIVSLFLSRLLHSSGLLMESIYALEQWEWISSSCEIMLAIWMTSCLADVITICVFLLYFSARVRRNQTNVGSWALALVGVTWILSGIVGTSPVYYDEGFDNLAGGRCQVGLGDADRPVRLSALLFCLLSALFCLVLSISAISETNGIAYRYKLSRSSQGSESVADANARRRLVRIRDGVYVVVVGAGLTIVFNILPQLVLYTLHMLTGDKVNYTHHILLTLGLVQALAMPPIECWCSVRYYTVAARLFKQMCPRTGRSLTPGRKNQSVQTVASTVENGSMNGDVPSTTTAINEHSPERGPRPERGITPVATPIMVVHRRNSSVIEIPGITVTESNDNASIRNSNGVIARETDNVDSRSPTQESSASNGFPGFAPVVRSHSDCLSRANTDDVKRTPSSVSDQLPVSYQENNQENGISPEEADMIREKSREAQSTQVKQKSDGSGSNTLKRISRTKRKNSSYVSSDYHHDSLTDMLDNDLEGDSDSETWSNLYDEADIEEILDPDPNMADAEQKMVPAKPKRKGKKAKKTKEEKGLMATATFLASMTLTLTSGATENNNNNDIDIAGAAGSSDAKGNEDTSEKGNNTSSDANNTLASDLSQDNVVEKEITPESAIPRSNNPFLNDVTDGNYNESQSIATAPVITGSSTNPFLDTGPQSAPVNTNPFLAAFAAETRRRESLENSSDVNETSSESRDTSDVTPGEEPPPRPPVQVARRHQYVNGYKDPKYIRRAWRSAALAINIYKSKESNDVTAMAAGATSNGDSREHNKYVTEML